MTQSAWDQSGLREKPLIGITPYRHYPVSSLPGPIPPAVMLSDDYIHGVETAGGVPMVLPFAEDLDTVWAYAERIDGLLLSGGDDMDPLWSGEQPRRGLGETTPERDWLEVHLISAMVAQGKPILGICRGIQVLNVAFGGTIYQDLAREWRGTIQHSQKSRRRHLTHSVSVVSDSRLFHLLGEREEVYCNSFHHQAVNKLGLELRPVAWDEEGLIEGFEHPTYPFLVAVQWHPENLWRTAPEHLGLFRGLVDAAREYMKRERAR